MSPYSRWCAVTGQVYGCLLIALAATAILFPSRLELMPLLGILLSAAVTYSVTGLQLRPRAVPDLDVDQEIDALVAGQERLVPRRFPLSQEALQQASALMAEHDLQRRRNR
jgi:hypothetical protein